MKKHAFLIVAHADPRMLQLLISLLDDERNDIFVLIDAASPLDPSALETTRSSLTLVPRMRVYWSGFSLIQAELNVLRAAVNAGRYHYYHLLSGSDLPLVCPATLHERLDDSSLEYVDIDPGCEDFAHWKVGYYHFLVETRPYRSWWAYRMLGHALVRLQAIARIDRTRNLGMRLQHGSAFFSITHDFAQYVLEREPWVRAHFHYVLVGEEVFLPTLAANSPFASRIAGRNGLKTGNLRYIDWTRHRGNSPYTFRMPDYEELREASRQYLFARKFNRAVDVEVIDAIGQALRSRSCL